MERSINIFQPVTPKPKKTSQKPPPTRTERMGNVGNAQNLHRQSAGIEVAEDEKVIIHRFLAARWHEDPNSCSQRDVRPIDDRAPGPLQLHQYENRNPQHRSNASAAKQ